MSTTLESMDFNNMFDELDQALPDDTVDTADITDKRPARNINAMLKKISVQLSLEVGSTDVSLAQLNSLEQGSVLELDKLAGEPLDIKVNGTLIGHAEVVVSGENYGLRILKLDDLNLESFT